jgi:regulator of cell morphogenesis and NO signaling
MQLDALIDHILDTHHARLKRELPELSAALAKDGAGEALVATWDELAELLTDHMLKEERILFPSILARLTGGEAPVACGLEGPITQMGMEHARIRELEQVIRARSAEAGAHAQALVSLMDDLTVHAGLEDDELFPAALALPPPAPATWEDEPTAPGADRPAGRGLLSRLKRRLRS